MEYQRKANVRSPMPDDEIVALYWNRNEKAIEETDFKYRKYLFSIAYNVLQNKLDSEECLNDTYLGVWNAIPPTRPSVFKAFLTTIARRISIKRYHSNSRKGIVPSELTVSLEELKDLVQDGEEVCGDLDAGRLGRVISDFIRSLNDRRRFIFMSRYYTAEPIDMIAKDLSLSRSMVNKELSYIKSVLREKLESEGYMI